MYPMDPEVKRKDLEIYEPVTDPQGPAMTWSMFAIGWLELKEIKRAQQQMSKCFRNITEPFKIWVETSDGSGAVNFLTGMGGFLQAIFFGYAGFRISRSCLKFDPVYPDDIKQLNITGICYLGSKLNLIFTKEKTTIQMTKSSPIYTYLFWRWYWLEQESICP
ncbi:protein-glucosylgalactosylhydroxylysine glucosidase-like [Thamnophis elegans]|uniref:protein-glucosylgalactosylhydroxylysine glucosidase-like n=1 Tax=Thamnophis elegans TaxID=35005 RepID=UPI0013776DA9|nr:protein-glucosylgalactosylhydroxylysine glucosidase-like [Thamnophis elegans]